MFRLEVVRETAGLAALSDEWNELLVQTHSNHIFLTEQWVSTWWAVYGSGNRLHVLVARDENRRLVGIAPLQRIRRLPLAGPLAFDLIQFIGFGGDVTAEYLDFIIKPGCEDDVLKLFVDSLSEDETIDGLDLRPFAADSRNLELLSRHLNARFGPVETLPDSVCPYVPLPETGDAFMATRSRNYRKKIGEYERKCDRVKGLRLRLSGSKQELRRDMDELIALHRKRWNGDSRAFQSSQYIDFHIRLSTLGFDLGWVRMFALEQGSRLVAMLYCFSYGGRYYYYQSGRDPEFAKEHVGLVLMHRAIQHAISEHSQIFDFLRGREEYKYRWAVRDAHNLRLASWKSRSGPLRARLAKGLDRVRFAFGAPSWRMAKFGKSKDGGRPE